MLTSTIAKLITEALGASMSEMCNELITAFSDALVQIMSIASNVLDYPVVTEGILYTQGIALIILGTKVAYEAFMTYILYNNGDSDADPKGLLFKTFSSVAIICTMPWLVKAVFQLGNSFAQDVSSLNGSSDVKIDLLSSALSTDFNLVIFLTVLVALVFLILIYIQTFVRGAHFSVLAVIGSIMALNITTTNQSLFKMWWKDLITVSISQAMQIFLIKAAFYTLEYAFAGQASLLAFIGFLWVAYKTPSFINQFKYSSGMGGASSGVTQQVIVSKLTKLFVK